MLSTSCNNIVSKISLLTWLCHLCDLPPLLLFFGCYNHLDGNNYSKVHFRLTLLFVCFPNSSGSTCGQLLHLAHLRTIYSR